MKDILIKNLNVNNIENDIYRFKLRDSIINCPQTVSLSPCSKRNNKYVFKIVDSRLDGFDSLVLGVRLPEIKGKGNIRFVDYPGLKLIKNFEIKINNKSILKLSGFDIFTNYFSPDVYKIDSATGHRSDYCNFKRGYHIDHTIFEQLDIVVPIFTQFGKTLPHSIFRVPKSGKVEFLVELNDLVDILSFDREFHEESISLIENLFLSDIKILVRTYNIQSSFPIEDKYIEENEFSRDDIYSTVPREEFFTNSFKTISEIGWFCKTDQFTKKFFISHPGFNASEKDFITEFKNSLLQDLVRVSESDGFKDEFPREAKFVCLENNELHKFDNLNFCKIIIRNMPKNHKIWFHVNILEFNRGGNSDNYNISKKFKYILGDYIREENRIIPLEIKDDLTIEDVSVPIDLWSHQVNTAGKDLRSFKSRKNDVFVNEPYIIGFDFVSKNVGYEKDSTVKAGSSERIVENNKFSFYLPYFGYNHSRSYYFMEQNRYPCVENVNFNITNILVNKPSSLDCNSDKNILNCSVEVKWKLFKDNNPMKLVRKNLLVFIKKVRKIRYVNSSLEIND